MGWVGLGGFGKPGVLEGTGHFLIHVALLGQLLRSEDAAGAIVKLYTGQPLKPLLFLVLPSFRATSSVQYPSQYRYLVLPGLNGA